MTKLNYVGHATVLIDIGQIRVLTDPIMRDRVLFLQRNGPGPAPNLLKERPPDIVLLSHLHYDHADLPSLRGLPPTTTIIAPRGSGKYLARGTGLEIYEMGEGDRIEVADVEITALPTDHGKYAFSIPRPMDACLSYVMRNHLSVYFAGDTDLFEAMHDIGQDFDLDLAVEQSDKNPVHYVQYAHARISSILRYAADLGWDVESAGDVSRQNPRPGAYGLGSQLIAPGGGSWVRP